MTRGSSRAYFEPEFGPRVTTSIPIPGGSSSSSISTSSMLLSTGTVTDIVVWGSPLAMATPQDEQNLAPSGFGCPHWGQLTSAMG